MIMKHERTLAGTCRALCALGAVAMIAGTSAAQAQSPATPVDKSATKGPSSSMDKKDSMKAGMTGMAGGGDMQRSMMSMVKNMDSIKLSGDTDRDFATMMKMHHRGAIDMAEMELKSGKDAALRAMATRIIKDQQKEIKELDQWLAKQK
jgi:uncharacterized protein (DUF305 family)